MLGTFKDQDFYKVGTSKETFFVLLEDVERDVEPMKQICERYGVEFRLATQEEFELIDGLEMEQEAHEDDMYYTYPHDEDCIILSIKDF